MRFIVDMPLSPNLATWLVQKGYEAVHVVELGLERASDEEILSLAGDERGVVITADLDYPRLLALARAEGPGLLLFRGGDYSESESVERMARVLEIIPVDELSHSVVVIEKNRIRRRHLPLRPDK